MRVITKRTLLEFIREHPDAKSAVLSWYAVAKKAGWKSPASIKMHYNSASILKDGRVVFNLGGNAFRLVAQINYDDRIVYVRFVGTHKQYDKIDAQTI